MKWLRAASFKINQLQFCFLRKTLQINMKLTVVHIAKDNNKILT